MSCAINPEGSSSLDGTSHHDHGTHLPAKLLLGLSCLSFHKTVMAAFTHHTCRAGSEWPLP